MKLVIMNYAAATITFYTLPKKNMQTSKIINRIKITI
jgi:hypothetical protein